MKTRKQAPDAKKKLGRVNLIRFCRRTGLSLNSVVTWIVQRRFTPEEGLVINEKMLGVDLDVWHAKFGVRAVSNRKRRAA
jgi:hypothetical protein